MGDRYYIANSGKIFHLPAQPGYENNPEDAVVWVDEATHADEVILDPEGRSGSCSICGACCPDSCEHKSESGTCDIYADRIKYGFKTCRLWPLTEGEIVEGCAYSFEEEE